MSPVNEEEEEALSNGESISSLLLKKTLNNILSLTMNNPLAVEIAQSINQLLRNALNFHFGQRAIILENFEELPLRKFSYDTEFTRGFEIVEHPFLSTERVER